MASVGILRAEAPTGLYGWIKSNDARTLQLFAGFALAIQLMSAAVLCLPLMFVDEAHSPLFGPLGYLARYVPIVFLGSAIVFGAQLLWYVNTVRNASGFVFVDGHDEPRLCGLVEGLLIVQGMKPPFVAVIECAERNAFACGISRNNAVLVVTRGLLDSLNDAELEAVLAHELAHIRNGDIRLMAAVNICLRMARSFKTHDEYKFNLVAAVLCLALPAFFPLILLGGLIAQIGVRGAFASRLAITSTREFIADAEATQLTKNPAALASALTRIDGRHRIRHMGGDSDAMMILGESEGPDASHPGVQERIDALVRVTGSMVFNAPGAASREALGHPDRQALFGRKRTASVSERAREAVPGGLLGFGRNAGLMMLATVAAFLGIHHADLANAQAMAAKFDVRAIKYVFGYETLACEHPEDPACMARQKERFRQLEQQRGTLVGLIGANAIAGIEGRPSNNLLDGLFPSATRMEPYLGVSGKLVGVKAAKDGHGDFIGDGFTSGTFRSGVPVSLEITELDQIGCYPAGMAWGEAKGHYSLGEEAGDGIDLDSFVDTARRPPITLHEPGTEGWYAWLADYVEQRAEMVRGAYDLYGDPGLLTIQGAYASPEHAAVLALLREEIDKPAFAKRFDALGQAKVRALVRDPERFVPCLAVRHGY